MSMLDFWLNRRAELRVPSWEAVEAELSGF